MEPVLGTSDRRFKVMSVHVGSVGLETMSCPVFSFEVSSLLDVGVIFE